MGHWTLVTALTTVFIVMYIAEIVTKKTKARVPSLLVVSIIFLAGYWSGLFPRDILDVAFVNQMRQIMLLFVLINIGTMFDIKEIRQEWRTVVVILAAVGGIVALVTPLGSALFGNQMALAAVPPLTGGGMATIIMSDQAAAMGLPEIAMLATLIFVFQGFFGFPLTSYFLRREGRTLIESFRRDKALRAQSSAGESAGTKAARKTVNDLVPAKYKTYTYYLTKLGILACIVYFINLYTGKYFSDTILQIAIGIIGVMCGFLEKEPLKKAESMGILQLCLTASFMRNFADSTPQQLFGLIVPIFGFLVLGSIAIAIASILFGKLMKFSVNMSMAVGLNCFLGFPFNYIICNEAISATAETEEEREYLNGILMPKMIISGIVAVSIVSTIVAGMFVGMM